MRLLSIPLFFISFATGFVLVEKLCHKATDGFSILRISSYLPPDLNLEVQLEDLKELQGILDQPFYYLASGGQSFVFISTDQKYVLKFFKFHHKRLFPNFSFLSYPKILRGYLDEKIERKKGKLYRSLLSPSIACTLLKSECALIYSHLQTTNFLASKLKIFDKLHNPFILDADEFAFVVQKKGISVREKLDLLEKQNNKEAIKQVFKDILTLSHQRADRGILDRDNDLYNNFGYIEERAVFLDVGTFYFASQNVQAQYTKEESKAIKRLEKSLKTSHPKLIELLDEVCLELAIRKEG